MDDKTAVKIDKMNSVLVKMEDIKNSQQSLIEKVGQLEVELFDLKSEKLDEKLEEVMTNASESFEIIKEGQDDFEMKRNRIRNEA